MRVSKVDTGVILEEGELKDDGEDSEMQVDAPSDSSVLAQQKAMKSLFGDDEKETGEESEIIPTLEPLPPHEVTSTYRFGPFLNLSLYGLRFYVFNSLQRVSYADCFWRYGLCVCTQEHACVFWTARA